jgi:type I restriction enzyme, R subunit
LHAEGPYARSRTDRPSGDDGSEKAPRYYQSNAVNAAIEAIAKGQDRILLVMATGPGKTYAAFQIIRRLWKAGRKKRILFLADRNLLVDQTMVNDFRPLGKVMAILSTGRKTIERADGSLAPSFGLRSDQ